MKWIELCREHIATQIERIKADDFKLYLPPLKRGLKNTATMHYHTTPELTLQMSGQSISVFSDTRYYITPGDICIIPPLMSHSGAKLHLHSVFMVIAFNHGDISFIRGCGAPGEIPISTEIIKVVTEKDRDILYFLNLICDISKSEYEKTENITQGLLLACFAELMLILDEFQDSSLPTRHPKVLKVQRLVAVNIANPDLNVNFVSQLVCCSPNYLSHLFMTETGVHLSEYINIKRIECACHLLEKTDMNISEIAYSCGYMDSAYFARVFRKNRGYAPHEWRSSPLL